MVLPFGPDPLVMKIGGKMFALISLHASPLQILLKCDPIDSQHLRDFYLCMMMIHIHALLCYTRPNVRVYV